VPQAPGLFASAMGDEEENPFRLPPDDQIFLIRERERQAKVEEREKVKTQKVWEKTTSSSRKLCPKKVRDAGADTSASPELKKLQRSQSDGSVRDTRRKEESVAEFVEKKREMFLVQMSLDVKNAEIKKLHEKAQQKNEALKKSQQMLDEDVSRFDDFLQKNDHKAHKAMQDAEEETKKKQDRLQRIKHLKSQLSGIQSEIAKHREQAEVCSKYKAFLTNLTPPEWHELKAEEKVQRKIDRRARWVEAEMRKHNAQMEADFIQEEQMLEERNAEAVKGRRRNKREVEEANREQQKELERRKAKIRRRFPAEEAVAAEYVEVSSGEEMPLFFTKPPQLLEVFTSLEEQNLFLIQSSQDKEQTLEEMREKMKEKQKVMGAQIDKLKDAVSEVEATISEEEQLSDLLRSQSQKTFGASERDQFLDELTSKIIEVNKACGYDTDHDPDIMQMLKGIENKLEEFLSFLDEEEAEVPKLVETQIRTKERERREYVKATRIAKMDAKTAERLETSLQRSQLPIHKKVGKQIMFRSPPLFQHRRIIVEDEGLEQDVQDHQVFGLYIDRKDGFPKPNAPPRPEQ